MKRLLSLIAVLFVAVTGMLGQSPAPGILNYQGVARNSVGNVLVNKSISLRLTIRDGSAAGPVVYQESRGVTTNPFGLFNVQLGSAGASSVTGTIAGVPWGVGLKYIQVEIDPNGGAAFINIGTAQLASVPYSLYATTASDLVLPFDKTQADAGTLFRITNSGTGSGSTALEGRTNSAAGNANAIIGTVTGTAPGAFSSGVRGISNGTGGNGIGVYGSQAGSGWGVYGTTPSGRGVYGESNTGIGVAGASSTNAGVFGTSNTNNAGYFFNGNNANTAPTVNITTTGNGDALNVLTSGTGRAGLFQNTNAANTQHVFAVNNVAGATGHSINATTAGTGSAGLFNINNSASAATALQATHNGTGANIFAVSGTISSATPGSNSTALRGINNGTAGFGIGVWGSQNGSGWGVYGSTVNGTSVRGDVTAATGNTAFAVRGGITGAGFSGGAFQGGAGSYYGGYGDLNNPAGFAGLIGYQLNTAPTNTLSSGVIGINNSTNTVGQGGYFEHAGGGFGVFGTSATGIAGAFTKTNAANVNPTIRALDADVTTTGFGNGAIFAQKGAGGIVLSGQTAIKGVSNIASGVGVNGGSATGIGTAGVTTTGIGLVGLASNAAVGYGLITVGRVQIQGNGAALNRVLTSDATGNATWQPLGAIGGVTGSGTLNFIPKWTPNGTNLGNSQLQDNASTVILGSSPFFDPNSLIITNTPGSGANTSVSLQTGGGFGESSGFYHENGSNKIHFTFNQFDVDAGDKVMTLDGNQLNVGIGTANPGGLRLNIHSVAASAFALTKYTNTGTGESTFTDGFVVGQNNATAVGSAILYNLENTDIEIGTNSVMRMWVKNNGRIGIGTPLPVGQLHVEGNGAATTVTPSWINYTPNSYFRNTVPSADNKVGGLGFADGSTGAWNEGLTGIAGSTAAVGNIGVVGLAGEVATGLNIGLYAQVGGSTNGNYGVYSLAPLTANSWAGLFSGRVQIADGTQGVGRIFTDDGAGIGTGSWQTPSAAGLVSGSGTLNFVPKWTPDGTTLGNSLMQDDGTKMNIGSIFGGMTNALTVANTPVSTNAAIGIIAPGGGAGLFTEDATGDLHITLNNNDVANGDKVMTFHDNTLNVGVGTVNPVAKFHIDNTATGKPGLFVNQDNELLIPAAKALSSGPITFDLSNVGLYWGDNSIFAQRNNFTTGTVYGHPSDAAISGFNPTGTAIKAMSVSGQGLFSSSTTGTAHQAYTISGTAVRAVGGTGIALHTSGNVRMTGIGEASGNVLTSDGAGNATWQDATATRVAFSVHGLTSAVSVPFFTYVPISQWAVVDYEDGSVGNYNAGTGQYTVPKTGKYHFSTEMLFNTPGATGGGYSGVAVFVNGLPVTVGINNMTSTAFVNGMQASGDIDLVAGDLVHIGLFHNTSGSVTLNNSDNRLNSWSLHLIK